MADIAPAECTVLGMPLEVGEDDLITAIQPISAVVVVKGLDEDGEVVYCTGATGDLSSVECLGMAEYTALKLRAAMAGRMRDA